MSAEKPSWSSKERETYCMTGFFRPEKLSLLRKEPWAQGPEAAADMKQLDAKIAAGNLGESLCNIVFHTADAEKEVNPAAHTHGKALFNSLAKTQVGVRIGIRQPLKFNFFIRDGWQQSRSIWQRRAAVQNTVAALKGKVPFFRGSSHH